LQATPRGNTEIIDINYPNLVVLLKKSLVRLRRIVSGLAYHDFVVTNSSHQLVILCFQKHKGALTVSLRETTVRLVSNAPGTDALPIQQAMVNDALSCLI